MIEKIAHYRVLNRLGAGGMGEVYLAEDTQLGRKVALKLLPREFTDDEVRVRRFTQEARAASALNHPNIITIYEIGRSDGHQYIATEYIEGETVRRIVASGRLKLHDALEIAIQTAQALEAAHRVGIIHRDIKPENIMRRPDGYIKILDFGLAKLTERANTSPDNETHSLFHTDPGTVLGTVAYMSPEQARGLAVDARTDVFSLGVVFYEMLSGKRPFGGATTSDVLVSILEREPTPLAAHLPGIPAELEAIIKRALAKEVGARYQSMTDMLADLKRARGSVEAADEDALPTMSLNNAALAGENAATIATNIGVTREDDFATTAGQAARTNQDHAVHTIQSLPQNRINRWWWVGAAAAFLALTAAAASLLFYRQEQINSIAILPFFNSGANQNAEYIGDGITEGLINTLSKLPELTVMSRNSVLRFKGREADAQEAGQSLGVRAVLLGQIKQEGDDGKNVVISAELVDARTRRQIWGDRFRRRSDDLLSVQDQIIRAIAVGLQLRLTNEQQQAINTRPTESGEAYELYMRGRYYWNQGTPEALKKADEYFERAAGLDPKYALAIAGCAACHAFGANYDEPPSASMPKAKEVALAALKQNDKLASVHLVLARVAWLYDWDFATAERKFKRALELDPGDPVAHAQYGEFLAKMGREGRRRRRSTAPAPSTRVRRASIRRPDSSTTISAAMIRRSHNSTPRSNWRRRTCSRSKGSGWFMNNRICAPKRSSSISKRG